MTWNLYQNNEFLKPLCFSNKKTQEDVVKEVLGAIDEGNKIIFIHGVCGTGKCLDKNTLVFCKPKGEGYFSYRKISEIVGKAGKIISLDKNGKLVESNFKHVRKTGEKKLFKLKTRTGREILASENHPLLTITEKGKEWKSLGGLNNKSYICLPNEINLDSSTELPKEEIKILAHLIAEGKLGDKGGSPKYYQSKNKNPIIKQDYIDALKKRFPDGEIKEFGDCEVKINFYNMNTTSGTTNKLRLLIRKYGLDGKKSKDKFVPKEIFGLNKENLSIFLSRLFSGDGSIYERTSKQIVIEYTSISKELIYGVSMLLNRFSIQHTISSKKFKGVSEYSYRILISESNSIIKFAEEVGFIGRKQILAEKLIKNLEKTKFSNIDKLPRVIREYMKNLGYSYLELDRFLNYDEILKEKQKKSFKEIRKDNSVKTPCVFKQSKIDFLRTHVKEVSNRINDNNLSFICSEDIFWDKIKSISFEKEDEVYDLEVEENHNFIANGIIVHNSAIALNIASNLGKTSIVVPGKNLQSQYKKDYEEEKYLLKPNKEKLKISVITGRNNHKCKFLQDNSDAIPKIKKESDSNLYDIFSKKRKDIDNLIQEDDSASNPYLPCKIEIREKNWLKIKEYLKQNNKVNLNDFSSIEDVKRMSIAPVCPYWSPVLPNKYDLKLDNQKKRNYQGLNNSEFIQYKRKPGCPFYEQFNSYIDSDVIVFNSLKYQLESALGRKPKTKAEIIDECDLFLDSFSNERKINIDRLQNTLIHTIQLNEEIETNVEELLELIKYFKKTAEKKISEDSKEIMKLKSTGIYDIMKILLKEKWLEEVDEESYLFDVLEISKMFEHHLDETYLSIIKNEKGMFVEIVTINLAKKIKELIEKNNVLIMMSGTLHSENVLRDIFGLQGFKKIDAEIETQGAINIVKTGSEMDCKYSNFSSGKYTRKDYLLALDKSLEKATRPTLVHVNAYTDLPNDFEIKNYKLKNLISKENLQEIQSKDKVGNLVKKFKEKEIDILFSTKDSRGIDFPGEQCNSIIFTKYPNPNVQSSFWKILMKTKPQYYWEFYRDKAKREFLQKIYRGLRFKEDKIELLSPDIRVLDAVNNFF